MQLTLTQPIERRAVATGAVVDRIEVITLRAPKLGDLIAAMDAAGTKAPGTLTLHLAAALSGLPVRDIEALELEDGMALLDAVQGFMPAGLRSGAAGSPSSPAASASPPTGDHGGRVNSPFGLLVPLSGSGG